MVVLENNEIRVEIAEKGAEIRSVKRNGIEYMWDARAEVWASSAPMCFPICGGLKDDKFVFEGKEYTLNKHGYAKFTLFGVEEKEETKAVFLHKSNETTKAQFPFDYELRVIYTLDGNSLKVEYNVKNLSGKTMYFNIGSHEAYYTPEGIEQYDVIFDDDDTLTNYILYGNLLSNQTQVLLNEGKVFPLYDKYFIVDALAFKGMKSRAATLKNRRTGRSVRIDFPDCPYLLLWHKHDAPFMCVEPWNGIPDTIGSSYDITEKEGITALDDNDTYVNTHTISFA